MNKKLVVGLVIVLAFAFVGCGATSSPEKTVAGYAEVLLSLEWSEADVYTVDGADYLPTGVAGDFAEELFPYIELGDVTVEGEDEANATVNFVINGPDIDLLQTSSMEWGLGHYMENPDISNDDLNKAMVEYFGGLVAEAEPVENTLSVEVVQVEGDWLLPDNSQGAILQLLIGSLGQVDVVAP